MFDIAFTPITDIYFYLVCIPAVLIVGLSKGGFGGAGAIFGVPIMSLAISPIQAAAIMLPILVFTNFFGLYSLNFKIEWRIFKTMLPGAILGIGIGWALAAYLPVDAIRLLIGVIGVFFVLNTWFNNPNKRAPKPHTKRTDILGQFWGAASGFTSFVCHAGGPLYQLHTLPMRIEPLLYTSTTVAFFSVVDVVKLIPYLALGQFDGTNLATSAVLMPYALACTFLGTFLVKRIKAETFYRVLNVLLFMICCQLIYQAIDKLEILDSLIS